jgi:alanyl-tRNA synthetase
MSSPVHDRAGPPATADELRRAFTEFFTARGHTEVPSASIIPHDKTVLFTVAGMVPFKPYFTGEQAPPFPRAVSAQKCVRAGGKHNDLEEVGHTNRHLCFFEMLGNFSFGDYFKADAIPWAYEFVTGVLGIDANRLWVTVHVDDDEAERIWRDDVGFPADRIQRLDDDNFWSMADTGPCGPSSEIFFDLGPELGPEGGPATGHDRYVEIWNLVFMQFDQQADGVREPLSRPSIDTGAGLERILAVMQGRDSVWETDVFQRLIAAAEQVTGVRTGEDERRDVSLRILAEHGRAMTFMVSDGVVPSNEERGYVLRRIIRRAVRHAYLLGAHDLVTPALADATVEVMGNAYPQLVADHDLVVNTVRREEERFRSTLARGLEFLDELVVRGDVSGKDAFFLHDTLGFPIDLTAEIASERGRDVDLDGFRAHMQEQRERAQRAHKEAGGTTGTPVEIYREVLDETGPTEFTGRQEYTSSASVVALVGGGDRVSHANQGDDVDVVLDRTPFYAESGGQIGDLGEITTDAGARLEVRDTVYGLPGTLVVHRCHVVEGTVSAGDGVTAAIDGERRDRIRRNHTATHLLHFALRKVLGSHVQQAGSLVAPDRLRFDFSHYEAVTPEQLAEVEAIANAEVISDAPVRHYETTMEEAKALGAIAFFGDKYGDVVRVLEAGEHSVELCGGTHVHALGFIGPVKIVSEGSIGSNLRRIEALTGDAALDYIHEEEATLRRASAMLRATPREVPEKIERLVEQMKALNDEIARLKAREAASAASDLAQEADGGVVVAQRDGLTPDELRQLAQETLRTLGSGVVALVGKGPDGAKAGIAVAVSKDRVSDGASAAEIGAPGARCLGGGTAKNAELVVGGGPRVEALTDALAQVRAQAVVWRR